VAFNKGDTVGRQLHITYNNQPVCQSEANWSNLDSKAKFLATVSVLLSTSNLSDSHKGNSQHDVLKQSGKVACVHSTDTTLKLKESLTHIASV